MGGSHRPGKSGLICRYPPDYVRKGAGNKQLWAPNLDFWLVHPSVLSSWLRSYNSGCQEAAIYGSSNMSREVYLSPWKIGRVHVKLWICWYPFIISLSVKPIFSWYSTVSLTFLHSLHPNFFNYGSDSLNFPCLALLSLQLNWGWLSCPQRV